MKRGVALGVLALACVGAMSAPATAAPLRDRIRLPKGFGPEGVASDARNLLFVGSIPTGAIYQANARTGRGHVIVKPQAGTSAAGLSIRNHKLYVAGAETGQAYVYNTKTGRRLATFQLTDGPSFINDVVATRRGAWFTDSVNPVLYRVPVRRNGAPGHHVTTIPLKGITYTTGFNVNGIDATRRARRLVVVQSNTGKLFTVAPFTGRAREIDLGTQDVVNGDGVLVDGRRIFVVENFDNRMAIVRTSRDRKSGHIMRFITDEDFDVPTTVAEQNGKLYVVNSRFNTPPTPDTRYWLAVLPKP